MNQERPGLRLYADLFNRAGAAWVKDRAPTMGAALAFYSAFSLAPLLMIVIALAGAILGEDAARGAVAEQLVAVVGKPAAEAIQSLLTAAQDTTTGLWASAIAVLTLLIGATTILVELQDDLDHIWKAPPRAGNGLLSILRARILSLGMFLGIGFLLLVSLVMNALIAALEVYFEPRFPGLAIQLLPLWNAVFSVSAVTLLFATLYKWLPNVRTTWSDVWMGAFITAVLFCVGQIGIGFYLGRSAMASAYGAAGTLVVLLLWLYYSAQVFLFGAEFTCIYATHRAGERIRRSRLVGSAVDA